MSLQVLPLAVTMMAGPQIMADIIFITSERPVPTNGVFLVGVAIAAIVGTAIATGLVSVLEIDLGDSSESGSIGTIIQLALVALLVLAAIKNVVRRETIEPPKWLGALQEADRRTAFTTGLLVILAMPSDILVMLSVGTNLQQNQTGFVGALPFIAATVLVAALPLLGYLLFRRRAQAAMPKVRDWMNSSAWALNVIVCGIFILLVVGG
jgi:threonine/homoserine/homoserine lactone efflux protein